MPGTVRRVGIAFGSLVMAYLAVALVAGVFFGASAHESPLFGAVVVVFGGLVFAEIIRRDRRSAVGVEP